MKSKIMIWAVVSAATLILFTFGATPALRAQVTGGAPSKAKHSLFTIAGKRRALLVVSRTGTIDVSNHERSIIEQALRADPRHNRRHPHAHAAIAHKLNEYIRKYRSMTAVERLADADYIIFFNLLEYRWPFGTPYPYGELFVIVKDERNSPEQASIIWRSEKVEWAGDAVKTLIKQLRSTKGEG